MAGKYSNDSKKSMTQAHQKLVYILELLGLEVEIEKPAGPYSLDCYVPKYHVGFEADGPFHMENRDKKRDDNLMVAFQLPVVRIQAVVLRQQDKVIMAHIIRQLMGLTLAESRDQRYAAATLEGFNDGVE